MSVTNEQVVERIRSWKGRHEEPMGSNTGDFVILCQRATFLGGTKWPWCAATMCRLAEVLGIPFASGTNSAGAHDLANRHSANWVPNRADWKVGMIVDYNEGTGHTGCITGLGRLSAGYVTSTDGNWNDQVTEHEMPVSLIRAVWKIPGVDYGSGPAPAPLPKPVPVWNVTTSASGQRKLLFRTRVGSAGAGRKRVANWISNHVLGRIAPNGITIKRGSARMKKGQNSVTPKGA